MKIDPEACKKYRLSRLISRLEISRGGISTATVGRLERVGGSTIRTIRIYLEGLGLDLNLALELGLVIDDGADDVFPYPSGVKRRKKP